MENYMSARFYVSDQCSMSNETISDLQNLLYNDCDNLFSTQLLQSAVPANNCVDIDTSMSDDCDESFLMQTDENSNRPLKSEPTIVGKTTPQNIKSDLEIFLELAEAAEYSNDSSKTVDLTSNGHSIKERKTVPNTISSDLDIFLKLAEADGYSNKKIGLSSNSVTIREGNTVAESSSSDLEMFLRIAEADVAGVTDPDMIHIRGNCMDHLSHVTEQGTARSRTNITTRNSISNKVTWNRDRFSLNEKKTRTNYRQQTLSQWRLTVPMNRNYIPTRSVTPDAVNKPAVQYEVISKLVGTIANIVTNLKLDGSKTIIYCMSRKDCEMVTKKLNMSSIVARSYTSSLTKSQKGQICYDWLHNTFNVLCTTHFEEYPNDPLVTRIIYYSLPANMTDFWGATNRLGRGNLNGIGTIYFSIGDVERRYAHALQLKNVNLRWQTIHSLNDVIAYCVNVSECRRKIQGDIYCNKMEVIPCSVNFNVPKCDNCLRKNDGLNIEAVDVTPNVQQIVKLIDTMNMDFQSCTAKQIFQVLLNRTTKWKGTVPNYGILKDWSECNVTHLFFVCVKLNYVVPIFKPSRYGGNVYFKANISDYRSIEPISIYLKK